jgi:uncharacterized protein YjbI with pentapeptide repeats
MMMAADSSTGQTMTHERILITGVEAWNTWRDEEPNTRPRLGGSRLVGLNLGGANFRRTELRGAILTATNLRGADLRGADLREANLLEADLRRALPSGADLRRANMRRADLREADLVVADLSGSDLRGADLRGADLSHADLRRVILERASLDGAEMWDAIVGWTVFGDVDLSGVRSLETVKHLGPSTIGIDTIYRSKGRIAEEFLRGAGVPEQFVTQLPSLTSEHTLSDTCFVAYGGEDEEFVRRLQVDLRCNGLRSWLAPSDLKVDERIRQSVDPTIRLHDRLLLVLSEHSIGSRWVKDAVEVALEEQRLRDRAVLFPIRLDDSVRQMDAAWLKRVRATTPLHDFSSWRVGRKYQESLDGLLQALRRDKPAE